MGSTSTRDILKVRLARDVVMINSDMAFLLATSEEIRKCGTR